MKMQSVVSRHLEIMAGFTPLANPAWRSYVLLDAEEKLKNPELAVAEVRLNRQSTSPAAVVDYPVALSWPLVAEADLQAVIQAQLELAERATLTYRQIPLERRVELLVDFGRCLQARADYWRQLTIQETYAYNSFVASFDSILEIFQPAYLEMMAEILSPSRKLGSMARIEHVPQGVIGVISPQNSSFPMLAHILHGALLSANAVLIKPPHRLAAVALALVQEFNDFLQAQGMPDGLISSVVYPHTQRVMEIWLGDNPAQKRIDNLVFIGNSKRRDEILQACQRGGIFNPIIELEGVDAAYIHDDLTDAQLEKVAQILAFAKNAGAGQFCISLRRLYVQHGVYDRLMKFLAQEFRKYRPGSLHEDDLHILGPSALAQSFPAMVAAFEQEGARVTLGGDRLNYWGEVDPKGLFIAPTLIEGVQPTSPLLKQELFANLLPVVRLNGSVSEAVQHINACQFGLRATIFANDPQVIHYMSHCLQVGTVVVNGNPLDCSIQIAGGRGLSTLDQNARIWPLDMSLRRVVTGGQDLGGYGQWLQGDRLNPAVDEECFSGTSVVTEEVVPAMAGVAS